MVDLLRKYKRDSFGCVAVMLTIGYMNSSLKSGLTAGLGYVVAIIFLDIVGSRLWKTKL